jgi:hypothetical protein
MKKLLIVVVLLMGALLNNCSMGSADSPSAVVQKFFKLIDENKLITAKEYVFK